MKRSLFIRFCLLFFSLFAFQSSVAQERVIPSSRVSSHLNVRSSPDIASAVVGTLHPGQSAELLSSVPYWYNVRLQDSTEGFVSKAWAQIVSVAEETGEIIRLGSWNIKKLGHGSSTDFPTVAGIIDENFDIVAIVEVMQKEHGHPGCDSLLTALGSGWTGLVTDTPRPNTTSGSAEFYAILYRSSIIRPCSGWTALVYHKDNDGSATGIGQDFFSREPAYACFEAPLNTNQIGIDFLLAAYHARWEEGDTDAISQEVSHLSEVFQSMAQSRPGERDIIIAGDFNLVPSLLHAIFPTGDRTTGSGSTLNSAGERTDNLYDHLLVHDTDATAEMIGNAEVMDVRSKVSNNEEFYRAISDHLPIMVSFRQSCMTWFEAI